MTYTSDADGPEAVPHTSVVDTSTTSSTVSRDGGDSSSSLGELSRSRAGTRGEPRLADLDRNRDAIPSISVK